MSKYEAMGVDTAAIAADPSRVVDGLVGAIKSIAADPNYQILADVFNEVLQLRTKNRELVDTNRNVFEQYWQFRNELEKSRAEIEHAKAALQEELACKVKELADLTDTHNSLSTELSKTKTTLGEAIDNKETLEADVSTTKTEIDGLRTTLATLKEDLSQVTSKLEEQKHVAAKTEEQNSTLKASLFEREDELEKVKSDLQTTEQQLQEAVSRGDGLRETLDQTQHELTAKTMRLIELNNYRVVMKEEPEDVFVKILDNVWTKVFDLVESHFQQDLADHVLSDASRWNNLRNADALKGPTQFPLPQTNSPIAKAMRIAAVLSVLSRTLYRYIFRPFYLLRDDEEFTDLLHEVEDDNPTMEENIRATLLATMPEVQQASAKARAQHVVREVSWVVQHLLDAIAYKSFCTSLGSACAVACIEWQKIQRARTKIEPYFGPPYDDFDWQELPLPEFDGRSSTTRHRSRDSSVTRCESRARGIEHSDLEVLSGANDKAGGDGVSKKSAASKLVSRTPSPQRVEGKSGTPVSVSVPEIIADVDMQHENAAPISEMDEDSEVDPSDIILVVWPSMVVVENGEQSPITQGLVISKQQASLAYHEVRMARIGHRSYSKRSRTLSIPSTPISSVVGGFKQDLSFLTEVGERESVA
ncbi:hypothetical protein CMQ_2630 [Grosmannia clavigera kw1407]|uniref:Mei5 protein n=1 Tax=Grosmannia clavigera (strain kw1407 / UAMH 11150) TaxID=655863 RepID=F0XHT4_GROCL|nr:uncharacterized protein CMQ_2630 [Grosmannia clavigera kw1407]EFX02701.1 hypothetical protein CMQ_2630 [Grosmannia clavigera kw1407]